MDSRIYIFDFLTQFNPYKDNFNEKRSEFINKILKKDENIKKRIFNDLTQIIRNYIFLEYAATIPLKKQQKLSRRVKAAILPALYEIFLKNKPEHVVNEWVKLIKAKKERAFANWLLREILRQTKGNKKNITMPRAPIKEMSIKFSFPLELTVKISQELNKKKTKEIFELSFNEIKPVYMINKRKKNEIDESKKEVFQGIYQANNIEKLLPYASNGDLIIFDKTSFYPVKLLLPITENERVLDLCGAPGNKSFLMVNANENKFQLYINEYKKNRFQLLKHNIEKWKIDAKLLNYDGKKLTMGEQFDKILIDAPCTNTGVIANKPDVKYKFSHSNLEKLKETQLKLVENSLKLLKKGGIMVYAVCSFLNDEIEPIYKYLKGEKTIVMDMDNLPTELMPYYNGKYIKIIPDKNEPIGFQILRARKI